MALVNRAVAAALGMIPEGILWRFARRYVAGVTLAEAVRAVRDLNARGLLATLDILGEHVAGPDEARADGAAYGGILRAIQREGLSSNISVKPTHMGLKLDRGLCLGILRDLVREAHRLGNFVRLDMEDSTCTDETLTLYRALVEEAPAVGVVLQAYLKRSQEDAKRLAEGCASIRVCKGIYREPEAIAFQDRGVIRRNFIALLEILMEAGSYVGIATHDPWVIQEARGLIERLRVPREQYEFQMLLGVRPDIRERLRAEGERLRIYVPFGEKWRAYCLRRFRENPQILRHVLLALFRRDG
jgi:proline dehydrogenase